MDSFFSGVQLHFTIDPYFYYIPLFPFVKSARPLAITEKIYAALLLLQQEDGLLSS